MRLFVAVWPSAEVRRHLRAIDRPDLDGVRWTPEERWHITLRFLGEVDDAAPVVEAVTAARAGVVPPMAELGERVEQLGAVAAVPVAGLDDLAATVIAATAPMGQPPDDRPFHGHVTVARARGRARLPASVAGRPAVSPDAAGRSWTVATVDVVRSVLGPDHRYETLASVALGGTEGTDDPVRRSPRHP